MKSSTKGIIEYYTSSVDREGYIIDLFRGSIDVYTFSLHLQYYLSDRRNLSIEVKELGASPNISWGLLAKYFDNRYTEAPYYYQYGDLLMSYYQDEFVDKLKDNPKYSFIRKTGTNGSQFYIVTQKEHICL